MSTITLESYPTPVLGDRHPARLITERARHALSKVRRFWANAPDKARHRFRVWRLEGETDHMVRTLDRLSDHQLELLGLDRLTMFDVIEDRLVARDLGASERMPLPAPS